MPAKPKPRLLTVKKVIQLTPNMIRLVFEGDLSGIEAGCEGANCKIFLPEPDQDRASFDAQLEAGPRPTVRTYTVRAYRPEAGELDIDFVAHGDNGPASRFAEHAKPGDFLGFAGPSAVKIAAFEADWYLFAADMAALPVAAANLEKLPPDAKGVAIFEVQEEGDRQDVRAPDGMDIHWLIHPNPNQRSARQEDLIRNLDWPAGRIQTCIAGESGVIKSLRAFLHQEKALPREDTYISGYWKIGLVEDEHQAARKAGLAG